MAGNKQFDPTRSRIKKARDQDGNVPRSQELTTVVVFGASAATLLSVMPMMGAYLRAWMVNAASNKPDTQHALLLIGLVLAPLFAAGIAGVAINLIQIRGFLFVLKIKPEVLKPNNNLKNMFGKEAAIGGARGLLSFCVCVGSLVPIFKELFSQSTSNSNLPIFAAVTIHDTGRVIFTVIGVAAAFSVFDVLLSRHRWKENLKMDAYELKQDFKENDGNPMVKGRRRRMHRQMLRSAPNAVRKAAVVVANPTHIAIALEYAPPEVPVPKVLVAATDDVAQYTKELARQYGVPIVEDVPLARLLYATATVGATIPRETFVAVAELIVALQNETARSA